MGRLASTCAAVLAILALSAPAAPAAQSAGWNCLANDVESGWTLLASGGSFFPLPPSIPPEGPKVITRWSVNVGPGLAPIRQRLEAYEVQREVSEGFEFEKIGESALEMLGEGVNSFPTRIPVSEGNSVGLYGPEGTLFCDKEEGAVSHLYEGSAATGEVKPFKTAVEVGTPVVVTVEDDRDNDGYGDETQDGCPASAAFQTSCPALSLKIRRQVKRKAILLRVTSTNSSATQVWGQVGWSVRQRSGEKRRLIVGIAAGPRREVAAGTPSTFRLRLTKPILRRLDRLGPKQSLRAKLTVSANDVFGARVLRTLVVRLRGRG
ncbi:MAG TPA: hypothetical protein VFY69_10190 [Solirubrobacterales bacterium]|nr:hypothetical protein [Solirubrobacterales bacterium]